MLYKLLTLAVWGLAMTIFGIMQFDGITALSINQFREFEQKYAQIRMIFNSDLSSVTITWHSFNELSHLTRLAASVLVSEPAGD